MNEHTGPRKVLRHLHNMSQFFFNIKKALSDNDAGYVYHKNLMDRLGKGSAIEWCLT